MSSRVVKLSSWSQAMDIGCIFLLSNNWQMPEWNRPIRLPAGKVYERARDGGW